MAKYRDEQQMLMNFLDLDYSQSWEDIEKEVGYAFGDYYFPSLTPVEIMPMVRFMWASLHEKGGTR